jgi:beta-N-acetylhexosaminidase
LTSRMTLLLAKVVPLCCILSLLMPHPAHAQEVSVDQIMSLMTVEERVGQVFMVDFVGTDTSDESSIAELIVEYKVGSVLISESRDNFANLGEVPLARQVSALTNGLQGLAYQGSSRSIDEREVFVPLFIAIEHEGNGYPHTQLRSGFTPVPSNMALGASWSEEYAQAAGAMVGQELASVGVNMLLGPVVDVLDSPRSGERGDLGVRLFGGNPYWAGRLAQAYIGGVHQGSGGRVVTIAKHFPGHGGSGRDPESEVATVSKSLEEIRALELVPFAAVTGYRSNDPLETTDGLLVGHIRSAAFQENMWFFSDPLTLDERGLGVAMALPEFANWRADGLLVADFLGADAIKEHLDAERNGFPHFQIARQALMAGNDILPLVRFSLSEDWEANVLPTIKATIESFQERYGRDPQFRSWVDESVRRILQAKLRLYGSMAREQVLVDEDAVSSLVGLGGETAREMAEAAVTLLYPGEEELRTRLPDSPTPDDEILILQCFEDCYSTPVLSGEALRNTLVRVYGPEGTGQITPEKVHSVGFGQIGEWMAGTLAEADAEVVERLIQEAQWVIIAVSDYNPGEFPAARAAKDLLEERDYYLSEKKVVAIAYDAPYHLDSADVSSLTAYFSVYGKCGPSLEASLRPLFDLDFVAAGASPVDVPAVGYELASALEPAPEQIIVLEQLSPEQSDPLFVGGDPLTVRTSVIVDRNGHPVPDGTQVEFRGSYREGDVFLEPQVVTDTIRGIAGASFWLDVPAPAGWMQVSAQSGEATSESLPVEVALPVTPFPTFTPTATSTASPTPTSTPVPATPTRVIPTPTPSPVPPAETTSRPVDWVDFFLAATGLVVGNAAGTQMRRRRRKGWEREVQLMLYGAAMALTGYILYGVGLLNPASVVGWQGAGTRAFLLLLTVGLSFVPSGVEWLRSH